MSNPENEYTLSKTETKLFSNLVMFGGQTKQEILLATDLQIEKAEQALLTLVNKGLVKLDEESGVFSLVLPLEKIIDILNASSTGIEANKKEQEETFLQYQNVIGENLEKFHESLEKQFGEFKTSSNVLQASLKEDLEVTEQQRVKRSEELSETLLSSFSNTLSELQTELQTSLSSESTLIEKEWMKALDSLKTIPETGTRTLKGSIAEYKKELSNIIKLASKQITSNQSQLSNVVTAIEVESTAQIQEFFTNSDSIVGEVKTNLSTGLQESWEQEKEFINEIRRRVQVTLEEDIVKTLETVVTNLAKEIDKNINEVVKAIKLKTDKVISESSNQLKSEFKEFVENASELIQEQRTSLDVLNTELKEVSSEQKLALISSTFMQQLQTHLSTDLNELEKNYRRVQKSATDVMETIRRTAKKKLSQQNQEFKELIDSFQAVIEDSIARKDTDVVHLERLSQKVSQLLASLLISIPMRSNHFKTSLKSFIDSTVVELQESINESSLNPLNDIYDTLKSSQKRIDSVLRETLDESQNEIQKVITSTEQLNTTTSNLQENYMEKVQNRFEQRAKVMSTELEAIARNFQQVIKTMEEGFGDINDTLSSENLVTNIESSLNKTVAQLENDVDTVFTQNKSNSREFITQLDFTLQSHLDRTLEVIKEGFSQIKSEFTIELEKQFNTINEMNDSQQNNLISKINIFSDQNTGQFSDFKTQLAESYKENQEVVADFATESRRSTDEVVNLHKSNIVKYQEKGPNDVLSFINQIDSEVSNHNKNLKDTMDELATYYSGFSDSTVSEITNLMRQVQESGDKLSTIVSDSLQIVNSNLTKTTENIDLYYSDSLNDLENQIGVTTGFITSEVENSTKMVQGEIQILTTELKETVDGLNTELKDFLTQQDQEFKAKIPELSQEFSQVFDDLIQQRSDSNHELEEKTNESLTKLITGWNKQLEKSKTTLQDVTNAVDKAIEANLENLEVIVKKNVEQAAQSFTAIFGFETSKEDIFGLFEIQTKIKQANKRLKTAISESLKSHKEQFDQQMIPELVTSHEAVHTQVEEDLSNYFDDFKDLISSSQTSLLNQLHQYLKEEHQNLDFSAMKKELNETLDKFSQSTSQDIESISNDLTDSVQMTINEVDKSREGIETLFSKLSSLLTDKNTVLLEELTKFNQETLQTVEKVGLDSRKSLIASLDSYNNDLDKTSLALTGNATQITKTVTEDFDKQISNVQNRTSELFDGLLDANSQYIETLQTLATETSRVKPINNIRLIKLSSDSAKNEFINAMINAASKQVTIVTPNPTLLNVADLKAIPTEKRIYIITDFDFSKKGKKWVTEIGKPVNINFHRSKIKKLSGLLAIQDEESVLILPDTIGLTSTDEKLTSYLSGLASFLKGASLRLTAKREKSS